MLEGSCHVFSGLQFSQSRKKWSAGRYPAAQDHHRLENERTLAETRYMPEQVQSESRYIDVGGTTRLLIIQMVAVEASQLWRARSLGGSRVARGQLQGPSAPCSLRLQGILPSQQVQVRPVRSRWRPRQKGQATQLPTGSPLHLAHSQLRFELSKNSTELAALAALSAGGQGQWPARRRVGSRWGPSLTPVTLGAPPPATWRPSRCSRCSSRDPAEPIHGRPSCCVLEINLQVPAS